MTGKANKHAYAVCNIHQAWRGMASRNACQDWWELVQTHSFTMPICCKVVAALSPATKSIEAVLPPTAEGSCVLVLVLLPAGKYCAVVKLAIDWDQQELQAHR